MAGDEETDKMGGWSRETRRHHSKKIGLSEPKARKVTNIPFGKRCFSRYGWTGEENWASN